MGLIFSMWSDALDVASHFSFSLFDQTPGNLCGIEEQRHKIEPKIFRMTNARNEFVGVRSCPIVLHVWGVVYGLEFHVPLI